MSKRKLTALGCHIYAGGFTLGVREHFNVLAHFEEWTFGVQTATDNLKIPVYVGTPEEWPVNKFRGDVDFVFGNPPCAPWSQLKGKSGGSWQGDPRVQHWVNVLDLVDRLEPTVWACESVRGIYNRGRPMLEPFIAKAQARGYAPTHLLCNGLECGLPQSRPRYVLTLSKVELEWEPTGLKKEATIESAWKHLPKRRTEIVTKSYFNKFIRKAKPGEDLRTTFNREVPMEDWQENVHGGVVGRPAFSIKRLRKEGLSHVITGGRSFIHPTEHRFITVEEQQLLCGYPPWFVFKGSIASQYAQIGKAVMPPMAEHLAEVVAAGLRRNKKARHLAPVEVSVFRDRVDQRDVDPLPAGLTYSLPAPVKTEKTAKSLSTSAKTSKAAKWGKPIPLNYGSRAIGKGSGYRIREMLVKGWDPPRILAVIHKEFPASTAGPSDVSWNKRKLRLQGGTP